MPKLTADNFDFISNNPEVLAQLRAMAAAKRRASTSLVDKRAAPKWVWIVSPEKSGDNDDNNNEDEEDDEDDEDEDEDEDYKNKVVEEVQAGTVGADNQAFFMPMADRDNSDDDDSDGKAEKEKASSVPSLPTLEPVRTTRPTTQVSARNQPPRIEPAVVEESDAVMAQAVSCLKKALDRNYSVKIATIYNS